MSIYIGNNVYNSKTKINVHKGCGKNTSPRSIFLSLEQTLSDTKLIELIPKVHYQMKKS